jgi:beta-1,4-mannosyltransferase
VVLVLGDIGRSPRMQYHALALADSSAHVDLIGCAGSSPLPALRHHAFVTHHFLPDVALAGRHHLPRVVFLTVALLRVLWQGFYLMWLLLWVVPKPQYILVQTPPAVPTLLAAWTAARLRSARLVIDWHNFGYSMLALTVGQRHFSVRVAAWYERTIGRKADAHLCVSRMMREELMQQWSFANVTVLYDYPAAHFAPTPQAARLALFSRLQAEGVLPAHVYTPEAADRPALLISATSWTADEDFQLLLDALALWDTYLRQMKPARSYPYAVVLVTGRGPLRQYYEERIRQLELCMIKTHLLWVSAEDYPLLLGSADLGLCLHRSSSGFDLPMKVADMFGSGLPVCAVDYGPCLAEQVRHSENGLLCSTSAQLAEQLEELFRDFPMQTPLLDRLRRSVVAANHYRWADAWHDHARPLFLAP